MRGRGLKHPGPHPNPQGPVAPYAGAWIETAMLQRFATIEMVAPYAGAWIETQVRPALFGQEDVAPYAGAWIET